MEHLEIELAKGTEERAAVQKNWSSDLQKMDSENEAFLVAIESLFLLIKQEQMISKETASKNVVLENTLQKVQDYMISLDQFFMAISKSMLIIMSGFFFILNYVIRLQIIFKYMILIYKIKELLVNFLNDFNFF